MKSLKKQIMLMYGTVKCGKKINRGALKRACQILLDFPPVGWMQSTGAIQIPKRKLHGSRNFQWAQQRGEGLRGTQTSVSYCACGKGLCVIFPLAKARREGCAVVEPLTVC